MEEVGARVARPHLDITLRRFASAAFFGVACAVAGSGATAAYLRHSTTELRWQRALAIIHDERMDTEARIAAVVHLTRVGEMFCDEVRPLIRSETLPRELRIAAQTALQRLDYAARP